MKRACTRERSASGPSPSARASAACASEAVVEFTREEVFEACGRLALAHQASSRAGDLVAAIELASVFDLLERRVVG